MSEHKILYIHKMANGYMVSRREDYVADTNVYVFESLEGALSFIGDFFVQIGEKKPTNVS